MKIKDIFRIRPWHRGLASMLVASLLLVTFTQYYDNTLCQKNVSEEMVAQQTGVLLNGELEQSNNGNQEDSSAEANQELYRIARELQEYSQQLQETDSLCEADITELLESVQEYQKQLAVWNQEVKVGLETSGYPILLERQEAFEADVEQKFAKLEDQLLQAESGDDTTEIVESIQELLNDDREDYVPVYGTSLPNEVEETEPETEILNTGDVHEETSSYTAVQSSCTDADLQTQGNTALSEEMKQKAEELETPLQIYLYLKNHINYEPYCGSRKGATATFDSLAGNDVDQASLLIAMLRYQGYPARYARGIIYLDAEQAMNLTNTEDVSLSAKVLANLGIPVTLVMNQDNPIGIKMEHTWVETYVPYEDYRGAGNNSGESVWIPLDTSIKTYEDSDSVFNHLEDIGLTGEVVENGADLYGNDCFNTVLAQWEEPLTQLVEENSELTLVNRRIKEESLSYLPASLQYTVTERKSTCSELSASESDRITFSINGEVLATLTAAELYCHRLTLTYVPAEEADQAVLEQYGSVFQAPSYLLQLRGTLMLDGEIVAYGEPLSPGSTESFTMVVYSGKQSTTIENQLMAGGMYQITTDTQTMTGRELTKAAEEMETASGILATTGMTDADIYTDAQLGRLLDYAGKTYFAQVDIADRILAEYMGLQSTRSLSVGMTGYTVTPVTMMGSVVALEEGAVYIDIDLDSHGVVSLTGDGEAEQKYMLTAGMISSACESLIWEEVLGVESVSTIDVLNQACQEGIEVYALCSLNYGEYRSKLNLPENVLKEIDSAVQSGMIVTVPAETIQMGEWVGTGYMVTNPTTMAAAYMISGGLNGGYTQEQIEMAFIGNAILDCLDIALSVGGIVNIISLFAMANPVGIVLGVTFSILTIVSIVMAVNALRANFAMMEAYINGESDGGELVGEFIWNLTLTVATTAISFGLEKALARAAESYLTKVVGSRLAQGLLSENVSPVQVVNAVKRLKSLGYTDDFIRELADNISAKQLIRMSDLNKRGLSREMLDALLSHSRKLENYSDDVIRSIERAGGHYDDILKLVDRYGETFVRQLDADQLGRLGKLAGDGLTEDLTTAIIKHIDNFADYSDDTIKKIMESGSNADRILTKIDEYAKDFTRELSAEQLKRVDDILAEGISNEQFEVLLKHADNLDNYMDEVISLWKNFSGNSDDFLKLVDGYGDEFIDAFKKNGDEAVEEYLGLLESGSNTRVKPSNEPNILAEPGGKRTVINYEDPDVDNVRALIRKNEAADILAKQGYIVEQNPQVPGNRNPDYLIEGEIFDCYAPKEGTSVRNIASGIKSKINAGQTNRIILNLDDWHGGGGNIDDLVKQLKDWPIEGLIEVKVINQYHEVIDIYP